MVAAWVTWPNAALFVLAVVLAWVLLRDPRISLDEYSDDADDAPGK